QTDNDFGEDEEDEGEDTKPTKPTKPRGSRQPVDEEQAEYNETKRLLSNHVEIAREMTSAAATRKNCPPTQRLILGKVAAEVPAYLAEMQKAARRGWNTSRS